MARILVAGLNPAWQKILEFEGLHPGEVNRAGTLVQLASGKGMNAAKVLRRLGHDVTLLQVLGGANGQRCLVACQALGIRSVHAWVEEETRQCLTLVDRAKGAVTEIIEPFAVETAGVAGTLLAALPSGPFDALLLCGTVPQGLPEDMYARILDRCRPGLRILDAYRGVEDALSRLAPGEAGEGGAFLKINRKEYAALEEALSRLPAPGPMVLVTDGPSAADVVRDGKVLARLPLSPLAGVRNPIGAGDTVTAGTAHFLLQGRDPVEAFRHGLAMGSASCLDLEPAQFAWETYRTLLAGVGPAGKGT